MSEHKAVIGWKRESADFTYASYNRDHDWAFEGGTRLRASAAPQFRGNAAHPDPESALVAALSSCHMLTFLAIAARKGYVVDSYRDEAVGHLEKNANGKLAVTRVELHPVIAFGGTKVPADAELAQLHDASHHECFIANSVLTQVTVVPR